MEIRLDFVANSAEEVYPLFASMVGGLGAFITGSNTVSNLMLSGFQFNVAANPGLSTARMVALQAAGGSSRQI